MEDTPKVKKSHKKKYPWQSPLKIFFLIIALIFSAYITINMPASQKTDWVYDETTNTMHEVVVESKKSSQADTASTSQNATQVVEEKESNFDKIIKKLQSFTRLFTMVAIAAFIAGLMEGRAWHVYLGFFLKKVTKAARLPQIIGISMPVALYSSVSANAMLVSSHNQGEISTSSLITGGMANSYLAHFSHSVRVMYPVVALIGLPGILYFIVQLFGGFLVIVIAFCVNRFKCRNNAIEEWDNTKAEQGKKILSWAKSIKLGLMRSLALLFRMAYITIPLMLTMEWLLKTGAFDFWEQNIPTQISKYFPAELFTIIIAQIGGLVQSSAVSANLLAEGLITNPQILLAMLVASAVGNPLRTLRRNLPTALGVFPPKVAFTVVLTMQFARFLITLIGSILVIVWMNYFYFMN